MRTPFNEFFRLFINKKNKQRLNNHSDFSVLSNNCYGAIILHDLGLRFNSPFVNLWIKPKDFIKYLKNIDYYTNCKLEFIQEDNINYPIGKLDDIYLYFQHYKSEDEAELKWYSRSKRINKDNLFILFSERDGCTYEDLIEFDKLPFKNKIVFTHKQYKEIKSSYYIKGFENDEYVGDCYKFINIFSGKKILDQFDYVNWFNNN